MTASVQLSLRTPSIKYRNDKLEEKRHTNFALVKTRNSNTSFGTSENGRIQPRTQQVSDGLKAVISGLLLCNVEKRQTPVFEAMNYE